MSKIAPHYSTNRSILADVIPLSMPYSIQVEPSQVCNLKCNYCMQAFYPEHGRELMTGYTFSKLLDRIMEFDGKLKQLNFAGWGEPLINPTVNYMIAAAKALDIADNIAVITNGLLLTHDTVDSFIAAGIDHIRISLQGITDNAYEKVCGKKVDFRKFVSNIKYLYEHKGNCKLSVKVADIALEEFGEEAFYYMFEDITDQMYVEHIRPMFHEGFQDGMTVSKYGIDHPPVIACPLPFYMMAVTATGDILPCCSYVDPTNFGNIDKVSLKEVWESNEMKGFQTLLLAGCRKEQDLLPICRDCLMPDAVITPGDELDERANEIMERL